MTTRTLAALAVALVACGKPAGPVTEAELKNEQLTARLTSRPFSLVVRNAAGEEMVATAAPPSATRDQPTMADQIVPGWDGYQQHLGDWAEAGEGELSEVTATQATFTASRDGLTFTVTVQVDGPRVRVASRVAGSNLNYSRLRFVLHADEHFFGEGERYQTVDHRGQSLFSWAEEAGLGGGEAPFLDKTNPYPNGPSMTYFPLPFFLTNLGYAAHVATTRRSTVHLGSQTPGEWSVEVNGAEVPLTFYVRETPAALLNDFTADTGRPLIPAPWAWGPRRRINRGAKVDGVDEWKVMRERKMPITGLDDAMHTLPANSHFGIETELKAWTSSLHAAGFKVMAYNNPYVSQSAESAAAEYAYGRDNGLFEKAPTGEPAVTFFISGSPQNISAIDLTVPKGVEWFHQLLQRTVDLGYDGWMHDFGEYVARTSTFGDGRRGDEVHNDYPVLSVKAAHSFFEARRPNDYLFFARSGFTGSQAYAPMIWSGDPEASFDDSQGLPAQLRGGINLGLSGVPYWGSDVGGFKCLTDALRDKEVFARWYQVGAVSPMMMDQDACVNPVKGRQEKWKLWADEQTQGIYRDTATLHTRLAPYFRVLAKEAAATGMPLMRHPVLLFPKEPASWSVEDAYFLGPALYAAPVVRRGVTVRSVWLPPGRYLELTERSVHQGGAVVQVPAPLERLPLFLVADQVLPLLDREVQTLVDATDGTVTEKTKADVLDVVVALTASGSATITLADGAVLTASTGGAAQVFAATDEAGLRECSSCALVEGARVRVNSELVGESEVRFEGVELRYQGPTRRIRWDVTKLP